MDLFEGFHPAISRWFTQTFGNPTPAQAGVWPRITAGENVLLLAPTGSGKTLAAFLKCLDWLYRNASDSPKGVRILYVSPLKALNNDINRNLQFPLQGISDVARAMGEELPQIRTAVRTGDTPQGERQKMLRKPPHILITTPESLFLMLSSQARSLFKTVRFLILDEIHTLFPSKRGAHLSLSLERLESLASQPIQRIGLSATMRPLDQVAAYLGGLTPQGPRPVSIVDTGQRKDLDLQILLPTPKHHNQAGKSVWPPIYKQLYQLIGEHQTTLIFVNTRVLAEKVTSQLNQLAGREIARTHHGSISKEKRLTSEEMLKAGDIPCMVATSSLELGIDIGHIDLVVQIESPKEVARGLQRVGRAGHVVGLPSKGRIISKTRADLLESVVLLEGMLKGEVEEARAPHNCLDVLAQQMVAMTTERDWTVEEMYQLIRCSYTYQTLPRQEFLATLGMMAGSYESESYLELRPRLYWDRGSDTIRPDSYGKRLVYGSGGTIPDRGYFGVYLGNSNVRLGELDEEFVFESRLNDTFMLGTTIWRIQEIRQDRVIVSQARKTDGKIPFWKGENLGRSYDLGEKLGVFLGEIEQDLEASLTERIQKMGLSSQVSETLTAYLGHQREATGGLPTQKRLIVEEFTDEVGNWRILVHSLYGSRVNLVLGLLIKEDLETRYQLTIEFAITDDGVLLHCPPGARAPKIHWEAFPVLQIRETIARLISQTSLFGLTFRHCAQRALVLNARAFGKKRTPLWLSRLKAGDLLEVVSGTQDFPLVAETYREILQDYLDLEKTAKLIGGIQSGLIQVQRVCTENPSPFAQNHVLALTSAYMYADDTPKGEARAHLFGLGKEALRTILGEEGYRHILDPLVISKMEAQLQGRDILSREVTTDTVQFWFERMGDIDPDELSSLFAQPEPVIQVLEALHREGRAKCLEVSKDRVLWVSWLLEDEYRQGLAGDLLAQSKILRRYLRYRGPFTAGQVAQRYGLEEPRVQELLALLEAEGLIEAGEFLPGGEGEEWCGTQSLEAIHQRSLSQARKEVAPKSKAEFSRYLLRWQGLVSHTRGLDALVETLCALSSLFLPAPLWEGGILPRRIGEYSPSMLDQLIASGHFFWRAQGTAQSFSIRFETQLPPVDLGILPETSKRVEEWEIPPLSGPAQTVCSALDEQGAISILQIARITGLTAALTWQALEELTLAGLVTNDSFGPIRFILGTKERDRVLARNLLSPVVLSRMGRWSLLPRQLEIDRMQEIFLLLKRYGFLSRELLEREQANWGEVYPILDYLENAGKIRRGYFVEGLSGIQYALPEALEMLRLTPEEDEVLALCWDDPANGLRFFPDPPSADLVVFHNGELVLTANKRRLEISTGAPPETWRSYLQALLTTLYPMAGDQKITVGAFNGGLVGSSAVAPYLQELGFEPGPKEMVQWPSARRHR